MRRFFIFILLLATLPAWAGSTFNTGTTSKIVIVRMYDASDSTPATGLGFGDMTIGYVRNEDTGQPVTEVTMTIGEWASGGWIEVDATNSPGVYHFGLVDASLVDGAESVEYTFAASGAFTRGHTVQLIDVNLRDGTSIDADVLQWTGTNVATPDTAGYVKATIKDGTGQGELDTTSGAVLTDSDSRTASKATGFSTHAAADTAALVPTAAENADAVLDEVNTGAEHNVTNSLGKQIRQLAGAIIHSGTAQGPGTGTNQIQFDAGASATVGAYDPADVLLVGGTGIGQGLPIFQYDESTKTATMGRDWKTAPDATTEFLIIPASYRPHVNEGLARGGTSNTITLNVLASSADDAYVLNGGQLVFIVSGTGADQVGLATAYDGTSKVLTIDGSWSTIPDTTSCYTMIPHDGMTVASIQSGLARASALATHDGKLDTVSTNVDAIAGLIAGLNDLSVADILAGTVDGAVDLATALKRILAVIANDADQVGDVSAYRNSADDADVVTHTITDSGATRSAAF